MFSIKLRDQYSKMTLSGKEKVGDREAYAIDALTAEDGAPERLFFDTVTVLLLRNDLINYTKEGMVYEQNFFEDYREVDGVKLPFTIRHVHQGHNLVYKVDDVKHNVAIDDAKFDKPLK